MELKEYIYKHEEGGDVCKAPLLTLTVPPAFPPKSETDF